MKTFTVTIVTTIQAESEHDAWEYGHALASKAPQSVARNVADSDADEPHITVEES